MMKKCEEKTLATHPKELSSLLGMLNNIGWFVSYEGLDPGPHISNIIGRGYSSGRGSGTTEQSYATRKVVATIVKAGDTNQVVERMKKALGGEKAVVMISPVDDLVMI
jgi:hypothetical protein